MIVRRTVTLALLVALAACSHASSTGFVPQATSPMQARSFARQSADYAAAAAPTGTVKIGILVPKSTGLMRPRFVSPSTKSAQIKAFNVAGKLLATENANLKAGEKGCKSTAKGLACTIAFRVPAGKDRFSISTFDRLDQKGHALAAISKLQSTIEAGRTTTLSFTLGGLAKSIAVLAIDSPQVSGTDAAGFSIVGSLPQTFTVVTKDADGNYIIGAGAPAATIAKAPENSTLTKPAPATPMNWTVTSTFATATSPTVPATTTIAVQATPVPNSGGTTVKASVPLKLYQPWIYAASYPSAVVAFDESGNAKTLSGDFSGLTAAYYLAYSSVSNILYVSDWYDVKAFDVMGNAATTSGSFTTVTGLGQQALDTHNNLLYFPNYDSSAVSVYDLQGNTQTLSGTPFSSLDQPWVSVFDSHTNTIYTPDYISGTMHVFDEQGAAQSVTGSFPSLSASYGLAFDPNNNFIYSVGDTTTPPIVTVYDEQGNLQTLAGGFAGVSSGRGLCFDPYNNRIYVSSGGSILAFDEQGNAQTLPSGAFSATGIYGCTAVP